MPMEFESNDVVFCIHAILGSFFNIGSSDNDVHRRCDLLPGCSRRGLRALIEAWNW